MTLRPDEIEMAKEIARQIAKEEIGAMDKDLKTEMTDLETGMKDLKAKITDLEMNMIGLKPELKKFEKPRGSRMGTVKGFSEK